MAALESISASDAPSLHMRAARETDVPIILGLIRELAAYEQRLHEVDATEADIHESLFGAVPRAHVDMAEWNGEVAGFALWFYNYSTFRGRAGIYLEDLFVLPAFRGKGLGKALIARLAQRCVDENLPRLQWQVLDWNAPSIEFYRSLDANLMSEWITCRMGEPAIAALATSYPPFARKPDENQTSP
jgi:GNAT superfamily N-acetyltransferase